MSRHHDQSQDKDFLIMVSQCNRYYAVRINLNAQGALRDDPHRSATQGTASLH